MTAPVDVLAVMDAELSMLDGRGMTARFNEAREARAAVAELLEACAECEQLESIFPCAPENMPDPVAYHAKMQAAYARRSAALARCKGGAA